MLDIKYWRDVASRYEDDPTTGMVSGEERKRLMYLSRGVRDALRRDADTLDAQTLRSADPKDAWDYSGKHHEIMSDAANFNRELKPPKAKGRRKKETASG